VNRPTDLIFRYSRTANRTHNHIHIRDSRSHIHKREELEEHMDNQCLPLNNLLDSSRRTHRNQSWI